MRRATLLLLLTVAGCNVTLGSLHDVPSRGADLPFEVGTYVRTTPEGFPSTHKAFIFRGDGSAISLVDTSDLNITVAGGGFRSQPGTYLVVPGGVELRFRFPIPDAGHTGTFVDTLLAVPRDRSSFRVAYHGEYETGPVDVVHTYVFRRPPD